MNYLVRTAFEAKLGHLSEALQELAGNGWHVLMTRRGQACWIIWCGR